MKKPVVRPAERRPIALTVKGTAEWKGWLDRLSRHCRLKHSICVDLALIDFARKSGFAEPPPER